MTDSQKSMCNNSLDIQVKDIPEYTHMILFHGCVDLVESILRTPGGREMLDAETARRKAVQAAKKKGA